MRQLAGPVVNPFSSAIDHSAANLTQSDMPVVIAANGHHESHFAKRAHQITETIQLRRPIDQVTPQKDSIGLTMVSRIKDLSTQSFRTPMPKMNVAHIHQTTRIVPLRQPLFANVEPLLKPNFQQVASQF